MTEADVALRCAWALVDQLALEGMEHACVSPGSRSTPLALALARHPEVRVHVHLDERAAAFFALGIAKATGRPVGVACTSGTASAELLPAVVEANLARVPLVLLTADRPPELRGVGANQTIDQVGLYGVQVKRFVDAPVPGERPDADDWRRLASAALATATEGPPGPVHLNLPFREPLVPGDVELPDPRWGGRPHVPAPSPPAGEELVEEVANVERGVIVAGSLREAAPSVAELARVLRWPLVAEPTSGLRVPGALAAGQFLLSNEVFATSHAPQLAVQFGAAPTSRAGLAFVRSAGRLVIVDPDRLVADPGRAAARTIVAPAEAVAVAATAAVEPRAGGDWLDGWFGADARARAAVDAAIDAWDEPYEGRIARDLAASLPEGSTLAVGSSMPVRDLDAYMRPRDGLRVLANRGASGIDGFVSTVLGVAASGARATALCGDLTLLHDAGSLLWSARRGHDAVLVVPNNGGGAIFSFLDQRDLPELEELFTTPHGLDLASVCAAAGAGHHLVERAADLVPAVERARALGGVHVVELPIDAEANVRRHAEIHRVVADALRPGA
ncbi:MAG: 2-succinyl-5-enolpyruvyl-6-hydroxy-3-cyclohexene-1-carboxylic-acid synthase [Actinomycetota bacterium]